MATASVTKQTFRMEYAISGAIHATPERIWALLTNAADFPRWNSTVTRIDGRIAAGEKIALKARIAADRVFNLKVTDVEPNRSMVWRDGAAPMFTGVRTFTLAPATDGATTFAMSEVFSGIMLPMIAGSLPDFRQTFEQYFADLKREAENGG
ncbi:MAG TPA: SRPBCC domain-containing protein [Anaerolineales bacterium]|nr:SRPBCC domain-containing protein [Anaerolineales bacterium]